MLHPYDPNPWWGDAHVVGRCAFARELLCGDVRVTPGCAGVPRAGSGHVCLDEVPRHLSSILRIVGFGDGSAFARGRRCGGPCMCAGAHHVTTSVAAVGSVAERTEVVAERPARNEVAEVLAGDDRAAPVQSGPDTGVDDLVPELLRGVEMLRRRQGRGAAGRTPDRGVDRLGPEGVCEHGRQG